MSTIPNIQYLHWFYLILLRVSSIARELSYSIFALILFGISGIRGVRSAPRARSSVSCSHKYVTSWTLARLQVCDSRELNRPSDHHLFSHSKTGAHFRFKGLALIKNGPLSSIYTTYIYIGCHIQRLRNEFLFHHKPPRSLTEEDKPPTHQDPVLSGSENGPLSLCGKIKMARRYC